MIRLLEKRDIGTVCNIVNDAWKTVYTGYVNEKLLNDQGCLDRASSMEKDFLSGRLSNFIYEYKEQPVALLSIGETKDEDKLGAFELWRIYIQDNYRDQGIGRQLIKFSEEEAVRQGFDEILIWAFKENTHAITFYKKHGYEYDKEQYLGEPYLTYGVRLCKKLHS